MLRIRSSCILEIAEPKQYQCRVTHVTTGSRGRRRRRRGRRGRDRAVVARQQREPHNPIISSQSLGALQQRGTTVTGHTLYIGLQCWDNVQNSWHFHFSSCAAGLGRMTFAVAREREGGDLKHSTHTTPALTILSSSLQPAVRSLDHPANNVSFNWIRSRQKY